MKVLEEYFKNKGICKDQVGICCPQGDIVKVRYWRKNGAGVCTDEIKMKWDSGMFCFKLSDGVIELI